MATELLAQAGNPDTPLEVLAELAHLHPELRAAIAANPSTYPDLLEWLGNLGDPNVDAALRLRAGVLTDEERAADPATEPEVLAELAYQNPELRATVSANPNAYDGLREWIARAGSVPAPTTESTATLLAVPEAKSPGPSRLTRLNAKFGPTFTLDTLTLLIVIAFVSIVSIIFGNIVFGTARDLITSSISNVMSQVAGNPDGAAGSRDGGLSSGGTLETSGSGDGTTGSQPAVKPAPKPSYIPTVLILDASGSMVRSIPSGGTRMAAARTAAITFVNGLGDNALMGLTVFGTGTGNEDSDRAAGCFDVKRVIPVGPVDKGNFTAAIAGIVQSGYTPLGPSMKDAAEQLSGYDTAQIVLVTDGVDTCSPPAACEIAAELHASKPGLTIHTIGFAVDADEQAQEQLSCIASAGGGEAVDAGSAEQLAARLRAISDPVSTAGSITATGFSNLKLGMSVEQAKGADPTIKLGKVVVDIQYADCNSATLLFKAGRLFGIQPKKSAPTAEGVRVGDDLTTAIGIYGSAVQASDSDGTYAQFPTTRGSDSGYRIYFAPDSPGALSGKIIRIVLCLCESGGGTVSEITNWQIGFDGVGPVKVDMPYSDLSAIAANPSVQVSVPGCLMATLATTGVGSQITLVATADGSEEQKVRAILVSGSGAVAPGRLPKLASGVGIGSSIYEVQSAYPGMTIVHARQQDYWIVTNARGVSIIFGPGQGDVVSSIQVSSSPAPLYEPCA